MCCRCGVAVSAVGGNVEPKWKHTCFVLLVASVAFGRGMEEIVAGTGGDVLSFEIRRLENAIAKLEESNAALLEVLEEEEDEEFRVAVRENEQVMEGMRSKIAELHALRGSAPPVVPVEQGVAPVVPSVAQGGGGSGKGKEDEEEAGDSMPSMDDEGGLYL